MIIFKILNSGDFKQGTEANDYANATALQLANKFCEKAINPKIYKTVKTIVICILSIIHNFTVLDYNGKKLIQIFWTKSFFTF